MTDQVPASVHESVKEDFTIEIKETRIQNECYREFIKWVANEVGTTQETEPIKARIHTLIEKETKLQNIQDNRPLTRHPFEGFGKQVIKLVENANQYFKLKIKQSKNGKPIYNRSRHRLHSVSKKSF